ncbi:MAG: hypothetical protein H8E41_02280 [Desulfobulbaceae bacterium]|uniref:Transmembrane protein (PGPGW) n=1 Tax=Candidatus Desulfobia pelagia TaxID=2841692 RepID=A0A8J6TF01_9BACT|nr:hypothetical protein [Candidatus Desulfobia pelagia]
MAFFTEINSEILKWCAVSSVFTFVVSLIAIPWIITRLPSDFFITPKTIWNGARRHHPALFLLLLLLKNSIGLLLFIAGIVMLVLPGQGILTIAIGIGMLNFPGKHTLLSRIVQIPSVLKSLNWIRKKFHHPLFLTPADKCDTIHMGQY